MIRAVLDTNQYVSMAIKAGGAADRVLAAWREERFILLLDAELTPGRLAVQAITRDPSDNMFLTCAVEGRADYIVSGDQDRFTISMRRFHRSSLFTLRSPMTPSAS